MKEKKQENTKNSKELKEIKKLNKKLAELEDKNVRLSADFINFKNRMNLDTERMLKYEGETFIKDILEVVDNFERAIQMDDRDLSDEVSMFLSGFKMIYTSLVSILDKYEVKEINALGIEFDPTVMEALLMDEDKTKPANVVLEVLQKGYKYKDKVIRTAKVKVNK